MMLKSWKRFALPEESSLTMSKCEVPMEVNFMRKEVKVVKEYWEEQSPLFDLDSETLTECVEAMETIEKEILILLNATDCSLGS